LSQINNGINKAKLTTTYSTLSHYKTCKCIGIIHLIFKKILLILIKIETDELHMQERPSLAIISNYDSLCGIAGYTYWLKEQLKDDFNVKVLSLNQNLLQRSSKNGIKIGDNHIRELANSLSSFDYVNLQFEPGTLGPDLFRACKRFRTLLALSPNMTITFHTVVRDQQTAWVERIKPLLKGKIREGLAQLKPNFFIGLWEKIYKIVRETGKKKQVSVIVHTKRDADFFKIEKNIPTVYDHPLSFLKEKDIQHFKTSAARSDFSVVKGLDTNTTLIGIFGFIAPYKGILTAIQSLYYLPTNYHLLIFGGMHPNEIKPHQQKYSYLQKVQSEIETKFISNPAESRIHFMGSLEDPEFLKGMAICDYAVFPYDEVGQSASGPITMSLEMGCRVFVARNLMTQQLKRYFPNNFKEFDIGAHLQLSEYIYHNNVINPQERQYNWRTNRQTYVQAIKGLD
jgi:glycosyltransferase involved in cell wall biosynthesis